MKTVVLYKSIINDDECEYYIFYHWEEFKGEMVWICDELERWTYDEACLKYPVDEYRWRQADRDIEDILEDDRINTYSALNLNQ